MHANDADLDAAVAPFTTDADLALDPGSLGHEPQVAEAMRAAGFQLKVKGGGGTEPGSWIRKVDVGGEVRLVPVDLIVPRAFAGGHGRRDARLPDHGAQAARWADGLEAALFDNMPMIVPSLEPDRDPRCTTVKVAGVPALLIAKCHKISDRLRQDSAGRVRTRSKDAGDVIRLMLGEPTPAQIGARLAALRHHPTAGGSVQVGVSYLRELFASPRSPGIRLAVDALTGALPEDQIRALAPAFVAGVLESFKKG